MLEKLTRWNILKISKAEKVLEVDRLTLVTRIKVISKPRADVAIHPYLTSQVSHLSRAYPEKVTTLDTQQPNLCKAVTRSWKVTALHYTVTWQSYKPVDAVGWLISVNHATECMELQNTYRTDIELRVFHSRN